MSNKTSLFSKIGVAATVGALALSFVAPVRAEPIVGSFTITAGALNTKIFGLTAYNTRNVATFTYAGFTSAYGTSSVAGVAPGTATNTLGTYASKLNMYTDTVNPDQATTNDGTEGTIQPVASTSAQTVKGAFTVGYLNGSGTSFNTQVKLTNFAKAVAGVVVTGPSAAVLPIYAVATPYASFQARNVVASTNTAYTGQGATGGDIGSQLTAAVNVASVTNATATGESNNIPYVDFNTGSGLGEYYKNTGVNFTIPAFASAGEYISTLTFTHTLE
jgi:hypothetical protein